MLDDFGFSLPKGLPARLSCDDEGFDRLCDFLGLMTRRDKQRVSGSASFKRLLKQIAPAGIEKLKTAERIKQSLATIYSSPVARKAIWHANYTFTKGERFPARSVLIPSIEYQALQKYDSGCFDAEVDESRIADCGAFYFANEMNREQTPALVALPSVRSDFMNWGTLTEERREDVLLAAFSIATILDDMRLLQWAASEIDEVGQEFGFVENPWKSPVPADRKPLPETTPEDTLWSVCESLATAVWNLQMGPPEMGLFDDVANLSRKVESLRDQVLKDADLDEAMRLIANFIEFIEFHVKESNATWLSDRIGGVGNCWEEVAKAWDEDRASWLKNEFQKSKTELSQGFKDWIVADKSKSESVRMLRECEQDRKVATNDLQALIKVNQKESEWLPRAMESKKREQEARLGLLDPMYPPGTDYDEYRILDPELEPEPEEGSKVSPDEAVPDQSNPGQDVQESADRLKADMTDAEGPMSLTVSEQSSVSSEPKDKPKPRSTTKKKGTSSKKQKPLKPEDIAVWNAVGQGRLSLAYHIAGLRSAGKPRTSNHPSPELLAAVAIGEKLDGPGGAMAQEFGFYAESVLADLDFRKVEDSVRDALNLLLFCASARAAIFAPQTGAISLLQEVELSAGLAPVYRLAVKLSECAQRLQAIHFDVYSLKSVLNGTSWEARMESHSAKVRDWSDTAQSKGFSYGPTVKVWKAWIAHDGLLARLAEMISGAGKRHESEVRGIVDRLAEKKGFEQLVEETRGNISTIRRSDTIQGTGLKQLENAVAGLVSLGQDWLRIIESRPGAEGFVDETVTELRRQLDSLVPEVLSVLDDVRNAGPDDALGAALVRTRMVTESFARMFKHEGIAAEAADNDHEESDPALILRRDLFYVTDLQIPEHGTFPPVSRIKELIDTKSHVKTLTEAFTVRLDQGDVAGAQIVYEELERLEDPAEKECMDALNKAISAKRRKIGHQLGDLSVKLEQAYTAGEASENELSSLNGDIQGLRMMLDQGGIDPDKAVSAWDSLISRLDQDITERFQKATARVREKFEPFLPLDNDDDQRFVDQAFANHDLILLNEILDCMNANQPILPKERGGCKRLKAFLSVNRELETEMESGNPPTQVAIVNSALNGADIAGLCFSSLSNVQRERSGQLLENWYTMARKDVPGSEEVRNLLVDLGFVVKKCTPSTPSTETTLSVQTESLRSRELCPVHTFGSDANGGYDVVLVPNSRPPESLVQSVEGSRNRRTIVLYFGRLRNSRDWLRNWSINNNRLFLVADESLVLYLSTCSSNRLRTLFECTVPFTATVPFFTAASLVPPESFYGRGKERDSIMDRWGSCFVYGGRQLGKTALLRSAEASFHRSKAGWIAKCIDLKVHDIGLALGPEQIWTTLWSELKNLGVIQSDKMPRGRDSLMRELAENIRDWVAPSEEGDNRILLLLDEADAFLASDMKSEFRESTRLKGLMDETNKRFKVVFSGLHNVLRTTERANHPLAHFGEPICVGPLLSNGELEQARALLMEPLSVIGCEFESYDLVTYILVWTNYYPSLIQSCGAELVKYLHNNTSERCFPHVLTREDVTVVLDQFGLRDTIRQRFSLTLQLDPRYEVIAYAIALELQGQGELLSQGLLLPEILEIAKNWWVEGFKLSEKEFDTLLQEMCGLGVLRSTRKSGERRRYTFRNPNVLLLLGTSNEISQVLEKERGQPEGIFDVSEFHAQYSDKPDSPIRGPLTYEQETQLKRRGGVTVISGTDAVNIESLGEFLRKRMEGTFRELEFCTDDVGLARQLSVLRPENHRGTHIYMVPNHVPWTFKWVKTAAKTLKRIQRGSHMRIVFSARPNQLWRFVEELPDEHLDDNTDLFDWFGLHPWSHAFVQRWCSDLNLHMAASHVKKMGEATGGWPVMLERYLQLDSENNQEKGQNFLKLIEADNAEVLLALGMDSEAAQKEILLLRDYGAFTPEDAREIAKGSEEDVGFIEEMTLVRRLWWAKQLGLIRDSEGTPCLNPLLEEVLQSDAP